MVARKEIVEKEKINNKVINTVKGIILAGGSGTHLLPNYKRCQQVIAADL